MISLPRPRSALGKPPSRLAISALAALTIAGLAFPPALAIADPPIPASGLALWARADAGVTTDASGNVSAWADQSSAHNDLAQTVASLRPHLVTNELNGLPVLHFDGTDDFVTFTNRLTTIRTVFWVIKRDAAAPTEYRFLLSDTSVWHFHSDYGSMWHPNWASSSVPGGQTFVNGAAVNGTTTPVPTTPSVISLVTTGPVTAANFSNDRNGTTTVKTWQGDLAELIIYDRALSAAERVAVEAYLVAKYQIGGTVTAPVISPNGGLFTDSVAVTAATATSDAEIRYTVDGSEPTSTSPLYTDPVTLTVTTTFKAKAFRTGLTDSVTTTAGFTNSADPNPASVSGLKLWLRADAGVPSGWGDFWADQSGNGNHAVQPAGVALPRLIPDAANGLPVMRFDGADDFVSFTNRLTTVRTVFWIIKKNPAATPEYRFLLSDTSSYDFHSDYNNAIWHPVYASASVTGGQTFVNGVAVNGTTTPIPTALSSVSLVTTGSVNAANFSFDRPGTYPGRVWWGDLAELVIYDRALTTVEREAVEGYLEAKYALGSELPAPQFSPGTGTYSTDQTVTISATSGATIRYTTDGTDPTETSAAYSSPLTVTQSRTIKAKAYKESFVPSAVSAATFTMKVANPALSVGGGNYTTPQTVTVTCATTGADIHYTTNGVDPTQGDSAITSGNSVLISSPATLKVAAWRSGWTRSDVVAASYAFQVATPTLTPAQGNYTGALPVTVATTTPGATLHYSMDGGIPTASDPVVDSGTAVTVGHSGTLKAVGFRAGWTNSAAAAGTYWISLGSASTPVLSPLPGTFTSTQSVTISTSTSGAVIRYTTDGTEPGFQAPIYASALTVGRTTVLKARAFASDMTGSGTAGGLYLIDLGTVDPPRFTPGGGVYAAKQSVTVSSETAGAVIHYRTDGLIADENDPVVSSGASIAVEQNTHFTARAFKTSMTPSAGVWADYRITGAAVAASNHTVALRADGTVWTWGKNDSFVLGDPALASGAVRTVPAQVPGIADVVAIATGSSHVLALKADGTVFAWGRNYLGELGNGSGSPSSTPVQASGLTDVVAIAAGDNVSLALKRDGSVWEWGGDNVVNYGSIPVQVAGLRGVSAIAMGTDFALAVQSDGAAGGTLWTWGNNFVGELGDGTTTSRASPVAVAQNVKSAAGGNFHSYAVKTDGTALAWGLNNQYQLGDGTQASQYRPTPIPGLSGITGMTAGSASGSAVRTDGSVLGWASNAYGQLGDKTGTDRPTPVPAFVLSALSVAGHGSSYHRAAVISDGTLWTWGNNEAGALGDGTTTTTGTPKPVPNFTLTSNALWSLDSDGDGLSNAEELALGTDGRLADTNGDGIPDGAARKAGLSATNPDMDGDGVSNADEAARGTDPFRTDTDDDSHNDAADCFPLDPARWQCPAADPNDHTPPVITLQEPTNHILLPPQ